MSFMLRREKYAAFKCCVVSIAPLRRKTRDFFTNETVDCRVKVSFVIIVLVRVYLMHDVASTTAPPQRTRTSRLSATKLSGVYAKLNEALRSAAKSRCHLGPCRPAQVMTSAAIGCRFSVDVIADPECIHHVLIHNIQ